MEFSAGNETMKNGSISSEGGAGPNSPDPHSPGPNSPDPHSPGSNSPGPQHLPASWSRTPLLSPALRALRTLGGLVTPSSGSGFDSNSTRIQGQILNPSVSSKCRTSASRSKARSSQREEPEALLDLILESQSQRLEEQRASLSLLPEAEATALCGTCSSKQTGRPSADFYYMLIHYQSDRMDDQRCSLPDLDDMVGSGADGQETFFSLVQKVQSRRMEEQRALLTHPCSSSHCHHHHHHHHHHDH